MSQELFYTSAPRGLQTGSRGFCTVAMTQGLPGPVLEKLEQLSGYRAVFPPHDPKAAFNPVAHMHVRLTVGGRTLRVLSRVCAAGLDYTQRANTFAHHLVLDAAELPLAGPAWLVARPGFLEDAWDGEVRLLPAGRTPPRADAPPAPCRAWQEVTGDAGWAGVLAEAFLTDPNRPAYLLFDPGLDPLPLLAEAIALLPPERRWDVTFSTYFTGLPQGVACAWRCVLRGSTEAKNRTAGALVLSLSREAGAAPEGEAAEAARQGEFVPAPALPEPSVVREPAIVASGRYQPALRTAESARPGLALASGPSAPPPGSVQSPWPAPERGKPWRAAWVWGFFWGLAASLLMVGAIFGGLWFSGALGAHDAETIAHLRDDYAKLLAEHETLKGKHEKLRTAKPPEPAVPTKKQPEQPATKPKRKNKPKPSPDHTRTTNPPKPDSQLPAPTQPPAETVAKPPVVIDVERGYRLPGSGSTDDAVIPLEKHGFTFESVGIRGLPWVVERTTGTTLKSETDNDGRLFVYLEVPKPKSRIDLCSFVRVDNNLVFRWERVQQEKDRKPFEHYSHYVADLVLDIKSRDSKSQLLALREPIRIPPKSIMNAPDSYQIMWDAIPEGAPPPGRVPQVRPERELILGSVKLSLAGAKPTEKLTHVGQSMAGLLKWHLGERLLFANWEKSLTTEVALEYKEDKMTKVEKRQCQVSLKGHWELSEVGVRLLQNQLKVEWQPNLKGQIIDSKPVRKNDAKTKDGQVKTKVKEQEADLAKKAQGALPSVRPLLEEAVIYMQVGDNLRVPVLRVDKHSKQPVLESIPAKTVGTALQ